MFAVLLEKDKSRAKVRSIDGNFGFFHPPGSKVNIYTFRSGFEDANEKAGVQNIRFHDLRHTFSSRLAQSGLDPYKIQKLMGHSSFTMNAALCSSLCGKPEKGNSCDGRGNLDSLKRFLSDKLPWFIHPPKPVSVILP